MRLILAILLWSVRAAFRSRSDLILEKRLSSSGVALVFDRQSEAAGDRTWARRTDVREQHSPEAA
jgi:hypothetical protein